MVSKVTPALRTRVDPVVDSVGSTVRRMQRLSTGTRPRITHTSALVAQQTAAVHVIPEELFRDALIREGRRSNRSDQAFLLLVVTANGVEVENANLAWGAAAAAVMAARRDTAVVGWLRHRSQLGVILPEIGGERTAATELERRVRQELSSRLAQSNKPRFSIRSYVYAPGGSREETDFRAIDELLGATSWSGPRLPTYNVIKRMVDVVGSLALLTVLSPLWLLIAALVKLTSAGPVFFRQARIGLNARPFTMLKFRTMHVNSDQAVHQNYVTWFINSSDEMPEASRTTLFKIVDDPRVTAVGRMLRKTSFDELPQLWNVLRGDMSLVGPRPPLHYEVEQYEPWHRRRVLEVKPGITGLWQVSGRSRTTFDEMVRLDLRYAKTCSLWTDIKILLATPAAVISGKGAC
jgi:exopolysaccharide biosynthesis polyprenyl glycosylphosphotransferase